MSSQGAKFIVALENTSNADFVLNLGVMLGNGKVMLPNAVHLMLTDRILSNTLALDFCGGPGAIAGRLDDYTVALQAGATYVLPVSLDKYCGPAPTALGVKLLPGRYQISARFDGRGALTRNLDMAGVPLLNFWTGTIQSCILIRRFAITDGYYSGFLVDFCRYGINCRTLCSRGLQPAFAFGALCPRAGAEAG